MKRLVSFVSAIVAASVLAGCAPVGHGGLGAPVLGLVATGDASYKASARDGGITKIDSVDFYVRNIVGILAEYCTIVRGDCFPA